MQKILGSLRRAVNDFNMIEDGDRLIVGVSGGKDSIVLLTALKVFQRFSPNKFTLTAVTIDMGFKETSQKEVDALTKYINGLDVEYIREKTNIAQIVFEERKEASPCSLCSKMRRGALNNILNRIGGTKLALGHNADDTTETMLMSLCFEGRFSTFQPISYMDRTKVTLIRPLIYVDEKDIENVVNKYNIPIVNNPCPKNYNSKRQWAKDKLKELSKEIPLSEKRIKSAIFHPERNNLFVKPKK